ncbi:MAG: FecR domain-containing protein [Myxococcaceae bacterium]|nr:FecR domain-containing protein [Myxococcaceae bacterium]
MMRHETERLWALAANELELEDKRYVELHLSDCPECRDGLEAVRLARRALETARSSAPVLAWEATDEKVGALVEKRLRASARPRWIPFALGGGLLATAMLAGVLLWPASAPVEPLPQPPLVEVVAPMPVRVEMARGLTRVAASIEPVAAGETLQSGDVLKTGIAGKAFVHLPDSSHVRVAAATQLALTRAEASDIALTVSRGRIAVRASHEPRQGFVVHAGDVTVQVVGTIFSVSNEAEGVEVAVSEGTVRVASGDEKVLEVRAGQRLVVDARSGKTRLGKLTPALERELGEVQGVAEAVTSAEQQAVVAAAGGSAPRRSSALPRLSSEEAKARQVTPVGPDVAAPPAAEAPPPAPETKTITVEPEAQVEVERWDGPGTLFPSLAGGATRGVPTSRDEAPAAQVPAKPLPAPEGPASEEAEWAAMPKAEPSLAVTLAPAKAEPAPPPKPNQVVVAKPQAKSLEQLFLEKAESSLDKGTCERFLAGLEDIALEGSDQAQLARVLRARCFDAQLRPRQAMGEYVKYLEAFPKGRFAEEARTALGQ